MPLTAERPANQTENPLLVPLGAALHDLAGSAVEPTPSRESIAPLPMLPLFRQHCALLI